MNAPTISNELLTRAAQISTATIHEAMSAGGEKRGHLPSNIQSVSGAPVCGRAFTVKCVAGSNLNLHKAIYAAQPGDVLVADCSNAPDFGYWGEVMAVAANVRQLAGLVLDGRVRDSDRIREMGFPVFGQGTFIKGTSKLSGGSLAEPIVLGETRIRTGDLIIGDSDGVVVVPNEEIASVIERSEARDAAEIDIFEALKAGRTTLEVYGL